MLFFVLTSTRLLPDFIGRGSINLTGGLVALLSNTLGIPAFYKNSFVTVSGFSMHISLECTAIHFLAILTAGILTYPGYSLKYKIKGIIIGNLIIILFNVSRIVLLGVIGTNLPSTFDFSHTYLWQGIFAIVVFFIWLIWVKRSFITMPTLRFFSMCLLLTAISVLILGLIMEPYLNLLARISDKLMLLTQTGLYMSDRLMLFSQTKGLFVEALGGTVIYRISGEVFYLKSSVGIYNSAIFLGLMTTSMVYALTINLPRKQLISAIKRIPIGIVILMLLHLIDVSSIGFLIREGVSKDFIDNILWMMRGISMVTPLILWLFLKRALEVKDIKKGGFDEKVLFAT